MTAIVKKENITAEESDVEAKIAEYAEKAEKSVEDYKKEMREGEIPPFCKGCHWIEEFDENSGEQFLSDFDNYLDMLWIGHTNECNANCAVVRKQ